MNGYTINKREENKDKLKSGIITAVIWSVLLLFVFYYKIIEKIPEKKEAVTTMLINFGDNRNGNGLEEPANQEGSLASETEITPPETVQENIIETKPEPKEEAETKPKPESEKPAVKEKILTGNNTKISVPKTEKSEKKPEKITKTETKNTAKTTSDKTAKTSPAKAENANSKTGTGDGKGTAAIGNLIKGRGTKPGTQGTNGTTGNSGDPLGGDGNGDSKIGVDRKLIGFIPGTMGRGGTQPSHNCSASGEIVISYTVDKAGNVISAYRSSGISDSCAATAAVIWVKKYVKAEKANTSSTGTYKITF